MIVHRVTITQSVHDEMTFSYACGATPTTEEMGTIINAMSVSVNQDGQAATMLGTLGDVTCERCVLHNLKDTEL